MYRSILIPLDGSRPAERVLPVGIALARSARAPLHLVLVHKWLAGWSRTDPFVASLDEMDAAARRDKQRYLDRVAAAARGRGLLVHAAMPEGFAADGIATYVHQQSIGLVVMSTHGRSGVSRYWFGSVAEQVLRNTEVPVLLCRAGIPAPRLPFRSVIVALDGSAAAETALDAALELAASGGARAIQLLAVVPRSPVVLPAVDPSSGVGQVLLPDARRAAAVRYLDATAKRAARRNIPVTTRVVAGEQPAAAILRAAGGRGADLVALATRGLGGVARTILGSVADKVIRGARVPVLVTRPRGRAGRLAPRYVSAVGEPLHSASGG